MGLQVVDLAREHGEHVGAGPDPQQVGDRIKDHHRRVELGDRRLHRQQVRLEPEQRRAKAAEREQALVDPTLQVDADRGHVADDLSLGLLEGEVHRPLAALAGRFAELRRERRLAGARGAVDEDRAAREEAAVEHRIQARHA